MQPSAAIATRRRSVARQALPTSWPAVYCATIFVIWVVSPFLRRLVDWKSSFAAISPIAALPLFILLPAAVLAFTGPKRRVTRAFELTALLWIVGMGYASVVACIEGRALGALYALAQFLLPLAFGYWIATSADDSSTWFRRISTIMIVLAVISGIYGIIQYVVLPPWDKQWLITTAAMGANGYPFPFKFRVFSLLNAPATFAIFLAVSTIVFLPRLTLKNAVLLMPVFAGLAISFIRESWVVVVLGIIVFASMTTRRKAVLTGAFTFIGVGVLALFASSIFTPDSQDVSTRFTSRLLTLGDIANDGSAADRARQVGEAFTAAISDPQGAGLGAVGLATRLTSNDQGATNLDSGYLARFYEMGVPGIAAFLAASFVALGAAIQVWRRAKRANEPFVQDLAALAVTVQIVMLIMNVFGDADFGLAAITMWVSLGLILRAPSVTPPARAGAKR